MRKKRDEIQVNDFSIYSDDNGTTNVNVRFSGEDVWLTQVQIAMLYDTTQQNVSLHINNVFDEGELSKERTYKDFLLVRQEGKRQVHRNVDHYNLDMIIAVGYRVKSQVATRFRQWATQRLHEYIQKGFALDDERMKEGNSRYFRELLQRIRDIRSSERNLYQQVTDIYATAVDYDPRTDLTRDFFATVQNKLHFAAHQHTAAEVIYERVSAKKPLIGMTNFRGNYITKDDVRIAKNYLNEKELQYLNLLVSQFLDFAELQALQQNKMTMREWIAKLDEMITFSGSQLLEGKGKISREQANEKADKEFTEYRRAEMLTYESDYDRAIRELVERTKKE
ncbi:MAG: virulence RhuM family protein [Planctomycetaceae bacterium]|nr:virulence RhuM family protein [Planctomycetaceae bacterium]